MTHTLIIAEAGVNHNGDLATAFKLVDAAKAAGADLVKFQTFKAEKLVSRVARKAEYQVRNTEKESETQFEMLRRLELSESDHDALIAYCRKKEIGFFSTAFDMDSLQYLHSLGITIAKVPSGELTNLPYLRKMAKLFDRIIISTGMAMMDEVKAALEVFLAAGTERSNITVLHCNTEYPTPMQDVNLRAMLSIREQLQITVGYSDHTAGIEVPIAAVALGATVIEKHFTLDKTMEGPDHRASLEPAELAAMVNGIRNVEAAIAGSGFKEPSASEKKNIVIARKSIHLKEALEHGAVLKEEHLVMLRPGDGISPFEMDNVIGRRLNENKEAYHKLSWSDLI
ncbi:N-acetylneuraminate synthase [uncultured Chitinophaga sp.]|uniref:N-acetylneuraminate synthase n=1 Tax=uncultured Chitinophaga sp. TaxID=339340 RepID=UPI0025D48F33|nr:N-acetylneuraminate synthase [uncultured Chitinophaga sp.]